MISVGGVALPVIARAGLTSYLIHGRVISPQIVSNLFVCSHTEQGNVAYFHAKRQLWTQRAFNRLFIRPIINLSFYSIHSSRIDSSGYYLISLPPSVMLNEALLLLYNSLLLTLKSLSEYFTETWKLFSEMSTLLFHVIPEKHIKLYNFIQIQL